jgi:hypothetical protein
MEMNMAALEKTESKVKALTILDVNKWLLGLIALENLSKIMNYEQKLS